MTEKKDQIISDYFYNPETGYTGANKLHKKIRQKYKGITLKNVKSFLERQKVVQVNKKSFNTGSFVPPYESFQFQIDLIFLEDIHLNKASYGLCCIDTFSKKATIKLMKRKTQENTIEAMEDVFLEMGMPEQIYCDEGSEFTNNKFKQLMKEYNIELIFTLKHASVVERFNRTIKEILHKYLQATDSKTISKVLPLVLKNYNSSYHKSIGMSPNEVNEDNQLQVWNHLNEVSKRSKLQKIQAGDKVRVLLKQKAFDKKYKPQFSKQLFTVTSKRGRYVYVEGAQRDKYLRAYVRKVDNLEDPKVKPYYEGTSEERLKEQAKLPRVKNDFVPPTKEERPKRIRKKVTKLDL